jgi:hypothetical protein
MDRRFRDLERRVETGDVSALPSYVWALKNTGRLLENREQVAEILAETKMGSEIIPINDYDDLPRDGWTWGVEHQDNTPTLAKQVFNFTVRVFRQHRYGDIYDDTGVRQLHFGQYIDAVRFIRAYQNSPRLVFLRTGLRVPLPDSYYSSQMGRVQVDDLPYSALVRDHYIRIRQLSGYPTRTTTSFIVNVRFGPQGANVYPLQRNPISDKRREFLRGYLERKLKKKHREGASEDQIAIWRKQFNYLGEADPTPSGSYCKWILDQVLNNRLRLPEDYAKTKELLVIYHRIKGRLAPQYREIKNFASYQQLRSKVLELFPQSKSKTELTREGTKLLCSLPYDEQAYAKRAEMFLGGEFQILQLTTVEAATKAAQNTGWCACDAATARKYLEEGPLYLITSNERYQTRSPNSDIWSSPKDRTEKVALCHFESHQVMDINDVPIHPDRKSSYKYEDLNQLISVCLPQFICQEHGLIRNLACTDCGEDAKPGCPKCDHVALCGNHECSYAVCPKHEKYCVECEKSYCDQCLESEPRALCEDCGIVCDSCNDKWPSDEIEKMKCCGLEKCPECITDCVVCEQYVCLYTSECGKECNSCKSWACSPDHFNECDCGYSYCNNCAVRCDSCGYNDCPACGAISCNYCDDTLCRECSWHCDCPECHDSPVCEDHRAKQCVGITRGVEDDGERWEEPCEDGTHQECSSCERPLCDEHVLECECKRSWHRFCEQCYYGNFCTVCQQQVCPNQMNQHLACAYVRKKKRLRRFRRNPAIALRQISGREFVELMSQQDIEGKHGKVFGDYQTAANYAERIKIYPSREPFVYISDLPLKYLQLGHLPEEPRRVEAYAELTTPPPPIYVGYSDYMIRKGLKPQVNNGNHRVVAARMRGDAVIDAIMTQESWKNIQAEGFSKS